MTPATAAPQLAEVQSAMELRLDFGCGETPREGFEGVDLYGTKAAHRVDLFKFPFPWADSSVDEIHCSHFLEHIPAREVEARDVKAPEDAARFVGHDFLFAFMDECWRILKPGGWMHIAVPCGRSDRAFQDPTHRRFFVETTFAYFWKDWRAVNVPQYPVACNFECPPPGVQTIIPAEIGLRTPEVQANKIRESWNVGVDFVAKLKAIKE